MRLNLPARSLRLIIAANLISMFGSGMSAAAITWYILQATHSEVALGTMTVLQVLPAMLLLPLAGVVIDRHDRRHLLIALDILRALVILVVAVLAFQGRVQLWHLYAMAILVATGFWMFWPTVTALLQELTPGREFATVNALLLAGLQGGWLLAGALVGFAYDRLGMGGILLLDVFTYVASIVCYLRVRTGRHSPIPTAEALPSSSPSGAIARFRRDLHDGLMFVRVRPPLILLGVSWALFTGAMLTQQVITAPLSDRLLKAGAVGYGWMNAGWATGAFLSALYAPAIIQPLGPRRAAAMALACLSVSLFLLPLSRTLSVAVALFGLMGSARGVGGVAMSSLMMELVPNHFMGRVQNTFYFAGTALQIGLALLVGTVAHRVGLTSAFVLVGLVYLVACLSAGSGAVFYEKRKKAPGPS